MACYACRLAQEFVIVCPNPDNDHNVSILCTAVILGWLPNEIYLLPYHCNRSGKTTLSQQIRNPNQFEGPLYDENTNVRIWWVFIDLMMNPASDNFYCKLWAYLSGTPLSIDIYRVSMCLVTSLYWRLLKLTHTSRDPYILITFWRAAAKTQL